MLHRTGLTGAGCWNRAILVLTFVVGLGSCSVDTAVAQFAIGGVYVDADGMLKHVEELAPDVRRKLLAPTQGASDDVRRPSALRKVSLARLEGQLEALHTAGRPLPEDVLYLAGLQRVRYIVLLPEERDVVIAGPAEDWLRRETGEVVGIRSGRPVLHLEDLVAALRYAMQEDADAFMGCSIDPTEDGRKRLQAVTSRLSASQIAGNRRAALRRMEQALGPQEVRVFGVPASCRLALVMLGADYRLKRIAMGHDPPPVKGVVSYLELAARSRNVSAAARRQHRWWFVGQFDRIETTPDRSTFALVGRGVRVRTAPGLDAANTEAATVAAHAPKPHRLAVAFAETFTDHFSEIAAKIPVLAELENAVAWAVVAELVAQQAADNTTDGFHPEGLLDPRRSHIAEYPVPRHVPSLGIARPTRSGEWIISVSGGVQIDPAGLLAPERLQTVEDETLKQIRKSVLASRPEHGWWWD